jgi:hypothetical protein
MTPGQMFASIVLCVGYGTGVCGAQSLAQSQAAETSAQWRTFSIPKLKEELASQEDVANVRDSMRERTVLPSQHETLKTTVGVGHVAGYDWGTEIGVGGRIRGIQTDFNAFVTAGTFGIEAPNARLTLVHPLAGWAAEAGDVVSELRGLARGARFAWTRHKWHRPTVSLYLPNSRLHDTDTRVGVRDEIRLFSRVAAAGELTSDGAHFARLSYSTRGFDVQSSYRRVRGDDAAVDRGITASYAVGGALLLNVGLHAFDNRADAGTARLLGVTVPIAGLVALTVEQVHTMGRTADTTSTAAGFQLLRGPVRLSQRYQWGETEYLRVGDPLSIGQRQLQSSASFSLTKRVSLSPQTVTQWLPDGRAQQFQELQTDVQLTGRAKLQLHTSLPDVTSPERFRARLTQDLKRQMTLVMDYGRVSAFHSRTVTSGDGPRFSVMLRKTWQPRISAHGGDVRGRVLDQRGAPVIAAGVQLGRYLTFTDDTGAYAFLRVPQGEYLLSVAAHYLPARYASSGISQKVVIRGATRHTIDITVVPLDSIGGRVYRDRNTNGRFDTGEGQPGVVVRMGELVTATSVDGGYGFYNLAPGRYTVRIDRERLADALAIIEAEHVVSLEPGQPVTTANFALSDKQKPVMLHRLGNTP